jgi:hypothetical protein
MRVLSKYVYSCQANHLYRRGIIIYFYKHYDVNIAPIG